MAKNRTVKAYLLSSSSSLFKWVKPADDDRTTKTATSRMDSLEHPVPVLRHLSVVTDLRPQVPPTSPLQTSGSALLSDVGFALLFHLGHIVSYPYRFKIPSPITKCTLFHLDHCLDSILPPSLDSRHLVLLPSVLKETLTHL